MTAIMIIGGLILLFFGGDALLKSSLAIADRLGISTFIVSIVVVGFGTSAPEVIVSVLATLEGAPKLALGNVVGSNIANILLILGFAALIAPVQCQIEGLRRDLGFVTLISALLAPFIFYGDIPRVAGGIFILLLVAYLTMLVKSQGKPSPAVGHETAQALDVNAIAKSPKSLPGSLVLMVVGVALLGVGANLLVEGTMDLAAALDVSNAVVGLTIVAVGTSLPELATAIVSAYRKHPDIVIGNIVGSNMFNLLGVLGVTALVAPVPIEGRIASTDIWLMIGVTILLLLLVVFKGRLTRPVGALFLLAYFYYSASLYM